MECRLFLFQTNSTLVGWLIYCCMRKGLKIGKLHLRAKKMSALLSIYTGFYLRTINSCYLSVVSFHSVMISNSYLPPSGCVRAREIQARAQSQANLFLSTFTTEATRNLYVFWLNGLTLAMNRSEISIGEQINQVGFSSFL